jgi:RluA family pseudouridine synthase
MIAEKTQSHIDIPLIATEPGWLIADKPWGISVHNDPGKDLCSLITTRIKADSDLSAKVAYDPGFGLHPVHRLDRHTSGVILLACNQDIFRYYSAQFENRTVRKQYIALLHGKLGDKNNGLWNMPLSTKPGGRSNPKGSGIKQKAETIYRIRGYSRHYTMIECEPLTGRKHQIRRHAKLSGHPVVGDLRYGPTRALKFLKATHGFNRLALHAGSISINPPNRTEMITVRSLQLPVEIQKLFEDDQPEST